MFKHDYAPNFNFMQSLYEPYAMIEYELRTVSPLQTMIFPLLFLCAVYMVFFVCVCVATTEPILQGLPENTRTIC